MSPVKGIPLSADHGNPVGVVGNRRGAVLRGTRPSRLEARTQAGQHHRGCAGCAGRRHGDIHDAASDGGAIKRSIHADGDSAAEHHRVDADHHSGARPSPTVRSSRDCRPGRVADGTFNAGIRCDREAKDQCAHEHHMWPFERPNAPTSHIGGSGAVIGYTCFEMNFGESQAVYLRRADGPPARPPLWHRLGPLHVPLEAQRGRAIAR